MNVERSLPLLAELLTRHFDWAAWEAAIERHGFTIERPHRSRHPDYPEIVYPIDYGYIDGTVGPDGMEIDLFHGSADNGLVALALTEDFRRGDREVKFLYRCTPEEIYLVNGFLNFDRTKMEAVLVMRRPMHALW